jgi:hypothetical protein
MAMKIRRIRPLKIVVFYRAVVQAASEQTRIGLVLSGAEFDSERNPNYIRQQLGAQSVIPAKRGKKT